MSDRPCVSIHYNCWAVLLIHKMNSVRGPEVKGTVEFKENQMRNEDCWNCSQIGTDEEISDAKGQDRVNIDTEKNAGDDDEKVVADQLPGNSRVKGW